jgi:hypothetical protein
MFFLVSVGETSMLGWGWEEVRVAAFPLSLSFVFFLVSCSVRRGLLLVQIAQFFRRAPDAPREDLLPGDVDVGYLRE